LGLSFSTIKVRTSHDHRQGFQAVRDRSGLDKKVVPYLARHTYGTYTMAKTKNTFAVADSMGHVDLKSMEPYQHQELEPLRAAINERNQAREERKAHVVGSGLGHIPGHTDQAAL
jgi:site-specific recombinase XerD